MSHKLEETPHFMAVVKLLSAVDTKGAQTMFKAGMDLIASYGYTTAQEGRATLGQTKLMQSTAETGELKIDVVVYPDVLTKDAKEFIKEKKAVNTRIGYASVARNLLSTDRPKGSLPGVTVLITISLQIFVRIMLVIQPPPAIKSLMQLIGLLQTTYKFLPMPTGKRQAIC